MTLEDVAFAAGTTASNLSRIELGRHQYSPDMLSNIAAALGVSVASLYEQSEPVLDEHGQYLKRDSVPELFTKEELPKRQQKMLENYSNLSNAHQSLVDGIIRLMLRQQRK